MSPDSLASTAKDAGAMTTASGATPARAAANAAPSARPLAAAAASASSRRRCLSASFSADGPPPAPPGRRDPSFTVCVFWGT